MKQFVLLLSFLGSLLTAWAQSPATESPQFLPESLGWASEDAFDLPELWFSGEIDPNITSVASGSWHDATTWDCGCIPAANDAVAIASGHTVHTGQNIEVRDLWLQSASELELLAVATVEMRLHGDLEVQGTLDMGAQTLTFSGAEDHLLTGAVSGGNLRVENGTLAIGGSFRATEHVTLQDAVLISDGHLILDWNGSHMASIGDLTGSSVVGVVRMQNRQIAESDDWIAVSGLASNGTFEPWNDAFVTYGFEGANYPNYGDFVSIMRYEEQHADEAESFFGPASAEDAVIPGQGYYLYTTAGEFLVNTNAVISQGDVDFTVSYTDHGEPLHDGFNLLGNPYPSAIHWDNEGWTGEGIDGALYHWNPATRQYCTYVQGLSLNGGSPLIPAGRAFIVHARQTECALTVHESAKTTQNNAETNIAEGLIHLVATDGSGNYDEFVLGMNADASAGFDPQLDGLKLMSDTYHNLYTKTADGEKLGINQRDLEAGDTFDLYLNNPTPGDFTLMVAQAPETGADWCMAIEDLETGEMQELVAGNHFTFAAGQLNDALRFRVHVGQPIQVETAPVTCAGADDASIEVFGNGDGNFTYSWYTGEQLTQVLNVSDQSSLLENVAPGDYTIVVDGNTLCNGLTVDVHIDEPEALVVESEDLIAPGCGETDTGEISVLYSGGEGELAYQWATGETGTALTNLAPGTYALTVTDERGCSITQAYVLEDKQEVNAEFEVSNQQLELVDGMAQVDITNLTLGADTYLWNMGDDTYYSDETPLHFYTAPGVYDIDLEASNADCFGMTSLTVVVEESTVGVNDLDASELANCWMNADQIHLVFDLPRTEQVSVRVYNEVGQLVASTGPEVVQYEHLKLDVPTNLNWAVVDVRYLNSGAVERFKVAE